MAEEITDQSFAAATTDVPLAIVDFWAPWCGPCKMMAPSLENLEKKYSQRVKFFKINVDDNKELASKYKIMSIPTLLLLRNGVAKEKVTGFYPQAKLDHYLERKVKE
ncbi:thioredoxin [Limosilactobacillus fastidiosus]|uniref:Thioredoxin n=1 Tax=Limosilactobacillus fastidiosus TaxID=2759855 RepID=A0A7W3TYV5_9LACO|nr:thioredoxin [Limosilactobacillus fastidiosus]MBB1063469.1 thioredoxin [Limosilactobacillus fastidiosus]MBB1085839.1 thioredoxin [Limosilactobacillus fastidiosus]MCD7084737.1 thioredoxin [Limosilactobacillus fastidiosus]MCD7085824.1 thioredoxin [Limosilactobacillus fastidiosus]MCD7113901.1 thioredoxin [Limosilactobacillus fastidiosus]